MTILLEQEAQALSAMGQRELLDMGALSVS
jgi:hypothetical protein